MTFVLLSSILFGKQYHGSATLISQFSLYTSWNTQQMRLQGLFIKHEIQLINKMIAPQIKEMNKEKIIIRNIKKRMK
jgi:hypothetical protein